MLEKIRREGKSYNNPLEEVTDLAGVRIICYFVSDVDKIVPWIKNEFVVDETRSVDKRKSIDPSVFGYASVHLIVELSEARIRLPEYSAFKDMKCEVQIRTILQHSWAEIEHDIVYKASEDIPFELRRRFASLAGLLEIADREFESLNKSRIWNLEKRLRQQLAKIIFLFQLTWILFSSILNNFMVNGDLNTKYLSRLVKFLMGNYITSVRLHAILSNDVLQKADEIIKKTVDCGQSNRCMLRYFVALGIHFKIPLKEIGVIVPCFRLSGAKHKRDKIWLELKKSARRKNYYEPKSKT